MFSRLWAVKLFVGIAWVLLAVVFIVEFVILRGIDPWGAHTYYSELDTLKAAYIPDEWRGYTLPVGVINFPRSAYYTDGGGWSATMTLNGRLVPATVSSDCTIAMIGDSVTFGHGVRDSDTFTNVLAGQFPDVEFRNLGINGYNTQQALETIQYHKADAYVYLMVSNDSEPALDISKINVVGNDLWIAIRQYFYHWSKQNAAAKSSRVQSAPAALPDWFLTAVESISERENVLMVGFAGQSLAERVAADYPGMILIPHYQTSISKADPHPDPAGHEHIANAIAPFLPPLIAQQCQ